MKRLARELGIPSSEVEETFAKYCSVGSPTQKANSELLTTWLKKQKRESAYILMGEALIQVGLNIIAKEVLDYDPELSGIALTDKVLEQMSWKLTKKDTKNLAKELGFSAQEIHKTFTRYFPESEQQQGNFEMLKTWMNKQESRVRAHGLLGRALMKIGLEPLAKKVLKYNPSKDLDYILPTSISDPSSPFTSSMNVTDSKLTNLSLLSPSSLSASRNSSEYFEQAVSETSKASVPSLLPDPSSTKQEEIQHSVTSSKIIQVAPINLEALMKERMKMKSEHTALTNKIKISIPSLEERHRREREKLQKFEAKFVEFKEKAREESRNVRRELSLLILNRNSEGRERNVRKQRLTSPSLNRN